MSDVFVVVEVVWFVLVVVEVVDVVVVVFDDRAE